MRDSINDAEVSIDPKCLVQFSKTFWQKLIRYRRVPEGNRRFATPRNCRLYGRAIAYQYLKNKVNITDEEKLEQLFKEGGENLFNKLNKLYSDLVKLKYLIPPVVQEHFNGCCTKIIHALRKLNRCKIVEKTTSENGAKCCCSSKIEEQIRSIY